MSVRLLRGLSIGYLLLPNVLFYFFWTRPVVALVGIGLLLYVFINQLIDKTLLSERNLSGKDWIYIGMLALFMTIISGITGICYQVGDLWAHNTKFHELYIHDWPLRYPETGPVYSYYFGYYLTPVLLSKMVGVFSEVFIFLWTLSGLVLGIAWLYLVLNGKMAYVLFCLCMGDPFKLIGDIILEQGIKISSGTSNELLPFTINLIFVPNQVIPALLMVGMLVYLLKNSADIETIILPITLSFWWAAFPAFTCGLLAGLLIIRKWVLVRFNIAWWAALSRVCFPTLASLPVLFLYESHSQISASGFIWQFEDSLLNRYISVGITILVFFLTYKIIRKSGSELPEFPFYLVLTFVLVFPFYLIGTYNDFNTRGMMPLTIIIGLYLLEPLAAQKSYMAVVQVARKSSLNLLLLFLVSSSCYWSFRIVRQAFKVNVFTARLFPNKVAFKPFSYDSYRTTYEMIKVHYSKNEANEYLGTQNSIYEQYVGKKNEYIAHNVNTKQNSINR